jgi:hypothetical protein
MSKVNKSEIVRNLFIAPAKEQGQTWRDIVQDVMAYMNMDRATARSYIINCWDRKPRGAARASKKLDIRALFGLPSVPLLTYTQRMTLEQALAQVPVRNERGHFIKREVREQMAQAILAAQ